MGVLSAWANFSRPSGPGTEGRVRGHGTHIVRPCLKGAIPGTYSVIKPIALHTKMFRNYSQHSMEFIEHHLIPRLLK